jgi:hypothetical protein
MLYPLAATPEPFDARLDPFAEVDGVSAEPPSEEGVCTRIACTRTA